MFKNKNLASSFSRKISSAARFTIEDMTTGRAQQEPAITDRLIAYIQSEVRKASARGFTWTAMTLTDRGKGSQEKKYGADFVGSLEIKLDGFHIRKGFLAQAKKIEPNEKFSNSEYAKLLSQCHDMLKLSPDSFVFLQHGSGSGLAFKYLLRTMPPWQGNPASIVRGCLPSSGGAAIC